jgi:hypothetical protein
MSASFQQTFFKFFHGGVMKFLLVISGIALALICFAPAAQAQEYYACWQYSWGTFCPYAYCTIECTGGNCEGTPGNDVICGSQGSDTIYGYGGADCIRSGQGVDIVYGGDGDDCIYGGIGSDSLFGGDGNDQIEGGWGFDTVFGDGGDYDLLDGGQCNDRLQGGTGSSDYCFGGTGNDWDWYDCETIEEGKETNQSSGKCSE